MNVLHVIPSVSAVHGGPTQALRTMESALTLAGVAVTSLTTDDDGKRRRLTPGARPEVVNGARRVYMRKWIDFYKIAPGAVSWLWCNVRRFDVVHIHALFSFLSICAGWICRIRGVPYVIRPLGTLSVYGVSKRRPILKRLSLALLERPILQSAAAIHFTALQEQNEASLLGVPLRGVIIPLGVQAPPRRTEAANSETRPAERKACRILFLSRLDPKKNIEALLAAFAKVHPAADDARLVIAGEGPLKYASDLKRLAEMYGLSAHIDWLGHVEGARKDATFASADIFVLPSLSENFGIAAVEAMAYGLPCVLGRSVAISGEAERSGAARAIDPTADEIATALLEIINDDQMRVRMSDAALRFSRENYSVQAMAGRLIEVYRDVQRPSGGHAS